MKVSAALIFRRKEDKLGQVKICIFQVINKKKKRKYISTPFKLAASYWNAKAGKAWKTPNADAINSFLDTEIKKISKKLLLPGSDLEDTKGEKPKTGFPLTFLQYLEKHMETLLSKDRIGDYGKFKSFKKKLSDFLATRNMSDFEFDQVDLKFLEDFDRYVRSTVSSQNTVHGYVKKFGTIFRRSISVDRYVPKMNPFDYFVNVENKPRAVALSKEQVMVLEKLSNTPDKLSSRAFLALNTFLFQIYAAGLRVGDTISIKWGDVSGVEIKAYVRKSKKFTTIPLMGNKKVVNIIRYYMPTEYKIAYLKAFEDPVMEYTLTQQEADQLDKEIRMNYEVLADGSYIDHPRQHFNPNDTFRLENLVALYSEISMSDSKKFHIFPYVHEDTSKYKALQYYKLLACRSTKHNKSLKELMPLLRTNINLTSHIARHSYANIARSKVGVDVVSEMLVHASIAETQAYLKQIETPALNEAKISVNNSF